WASATRRASPLKLAATPAATAVLAVAKARFSRLRRAGLPLGAVFLCFHCHLEARTALFVIPMQGAHQPGKSPARMMATL
ncbi:MAG: hypothetical protein PHF66_14575, partial [Desulfobacteraceae bacterium]|nr:hypothetical protein [Desulfobacteraceae bacterium]